MGVGMTDPDMQAIADAAAAKALRNLFLTLGSDVSNPSDVKALQADLSHIRAWRESTETVKQHTMKAAVTVIVTGVLGWLGLILWRHQ